VNVLLTVHTLMQAIKKQHKSICKQYATYIRNILILSSTHTLPDHVSPYGAVFGSSVHSGILVERRSVIMQSH